MAGLRYLLGCHVGEERLAVAVKLPAGGRETQKVARREQRRHQLQDGHKHLKEGGVSIGWVKAGGRRTVMCSGNARVAHGAALPR